MTAPVVPALPVGAGAEVQHEVQQEVGQASCGAREQRESELQSLLLDFHDLAALIDDVDAAPAPRFLFRPVLAAGDYGMISAEDKSGKSWLMLDAAVSVASGTPWLGIFECEQPGPALCFLGEGGKRKVVRRIRAICAGRDLEPRELPIRICLRAPALTNELAMVLVEAEVADHLPALIVIDPLYLAAGGARSSDLVEMGAMLAKVQAVAQRHGSALLISHHWNKTGEGRGAKRMSGVGPSAWGRVLVSGLVTHRAKDPDTQSTSVTLELDVIGDEVAETTVRIRRRVWADDPDDLGSPLHYVVEQLEDLPPEPAGEDSGLRPSARRVLAVLNRSGVWETVRAIGDVLADEGAPLKARTIQTALSQLVAADMALTRTVLGGTTGQWRSARAHSTAEETESEF